jgi:hypothetical protein
MKQVNNSVQIDKQTDTNKFVLLIFCLLFDLIGMLSYLLPLLGEVADVIWAPISAILIFLMFRKHNGAMGGVIGFMEEIMPGADIIPTFTLMWAYKYYFSKND